MQQAEMIGPSTRANAAGAWCETTCEDLLTAQPNDLTPKLTSLVWSAASGSVERLALVQQEALG